VNLQTKGPSGCLRLAQYVLGASGIGRIDEHSNARRSWQQLAQ
jgi:hypothetical protein